MNYICDAVRISVIIALKSPTWPKLISMISISQTNVARYHPLYRRGREESVNVQLLYV